MQKFEKLYIGYNVSLEQFVAGAGTMTEGAYSELKGTAFSVYQGINDKEKWLYQELMSLVEDIEIELPFTENFKIPYKNSQVRFELIHSFLSEKKLSFDMNDILNKILDHYILKRESYKIISIIAEFLWCSLKSEISLQIIDKVLWSYYSDDIEDRTILFNLSGYLNENFSNEDRIFLNDKYPDFISY